MEFIEADPLPEACRQCVERYCDECDHMGERWILSPEEERRLIRKATEKAIMRLQRKLEENKN